MGVAMSAMDNGEGQTVPWRGSDVAIGIGLVGIATFVLLIIYQVIGADPACGLGITVLAGIVYGIVLLAAWIMGPIKYRTSLGSLGLRLSASRSFPQVLLLVIVVLVASLVFLMVYTGLLSLVGWDNFLPSYEQTDDIVLEGPAIVGSVVLIVLWGPLVEEVFFRAFIFPGLEGWMGVARAAVTSSVLFAVVHVDPAVMVPFFVIGILLAWLYHKTLSLWSCFAVHATWNGAALAFSVGGS